MDESQQWVEFGRWLAEQREAKGLKRREVAKKAQVPEAALRDLETGRKDAIGGIKLLPNPSQDVLQRLADILDIPMAEVLARIGRSTPHRPRQGASRNGSRAPEDDGSTLAAKLRRLSDPELVVVERLVDALIEMGDR